MISICTLPSPLGTLTLAGDGEKITGLWMEGQKYYASTLPADPKQDSLPVFRAAKDWLDAYFAGERPAPTLPLAPAGSAFRKAVWRILCDIPYGQVVTYGSIAKQLETQGGSRVSAQAVGGAVGHNPISILIPCHRVVGANGSLTGYAGGVAKKVQLLQLERAPMEGLFVPRKGTAL